MLVSLPAIQITASDLLDQNDFNDNTPGSWITYESDDTNTDVEVVNGEYVIHINNGDFERWSTMLNHTLTGLEEGHAYQVKFSVRSDTDTRVYSSVGDVTDPYVHYWDNNDTGFDLTANEELNVIDTFTVDRTISPVSLSFLPGSDLTGNVALTIYFDDISIKDFGIDPDYINDKPTELPVPAVRVNQTGYFPRGKKRAIIVNDSTEPVEWYLKDDTGDYGKYTVNAGITLWTLLNLCWRTLHNLFLLAASTIYSVYLFSMILHLV